MNKLERIHDLVKQLNEANKAYYQENSEIMSNLQYDALYDELQNLEKETGVVLAGSPTITVGYELLSELPKEKHESVMLSLDKTKDVETLKDWLANQTGYLSWKMDGLTIVLTYKGGSLVKAVTRGNGEIGEVITNNAKVFRNIPLTVPFAGTLILRGEAVIKYSDFDKINAKLDVDAKYKNPRNLCSGSVRQLNNEITAARSVYFFAFSLVDAQEKTFHNSRIEQMEWLHSLGFEIVEGRKVTADTIVEAVEWFSGHIVKNDFPSDGLVLLYDDISYGQSLGRTAKFPRDSIAFKWKDELAETKLKEIEWSASRTGLINPIAIFEPVELEGTTVSRASVHNLSILENLELGIDDTISVYKANMIIPQIAENLTRSGTVTIPKECPICHGETEIKQENGVKSLYCMNKECLAKKIKLFTHFVSRDAMNIEGLSEATMEKLISKGFIHELADIFHLEQYKDEIQSMDGFGEKSYQNMMQSIENARHTTAAKFLYSLGIPNIGLSNAKLICRQFGNNLEKIKTVTEEELDEIPGVGEVIAKTFVEFFQTEENQIRMANLEKEVEIEQTESKIQLQKLNETTFVITGSLTEYENRKVLKEEIENLGGKVTGTVTSKTDYLINNDSLSNSSKNKKAKELGVKVITEAEFMELINKI